MAGFCNACGAPIGDGVRFCPACGKPSGAEMVPAATAGPMFTGSNPPPPSGGATKIVLIIVGIIGLILILMIGSCFYIGYRVKRAAGDFRSHGKPYTGKREPCSFVSAPEAADALGVPVQEATPRAPGACEYVLDAEGGRMRIQYAWQGGAGAIKLMRAAMQLGGKAAFTEAPELGDEALIGPNGNPVMMRKGDVLVTISVGAQGVSPEGEKKVAALIAERMGD
jgi:hypothetical protein